MTMSKSGSLVNPSRAAPHLVKFLTPSQNGDSSSRTQSVYAIYGNAKVPYLFVTFASVVIVTSSNLHDLETTSNFRQLHGLLAQLEWQRFCAFFCTVFKERYLKASIYDNAISFGVRARSQNNASSSMYSLKMSHAIFIYLHLIFKAA
jgi:hypothetical protein